MQDHSDKTEELTYKKPRHARGSGRSRRRAVFARGRKKQLSAHRQAENFMRVPAGFDPELLYVECARCGSPVLWDPGRATKLLQDAGIDPIEVDSSCILLTDGCPACGAGNEYTVRIFRISDRGTANLTPIHGHA